MTIDEREWTLMSKAIGVHRFIYAFPLFVTFHPLGVAVGAAQCYNYVMISLRELLWRIMIVLRRLFCILLLGIVLPACAVEPTPMPTPTPTLSPTFVAPTNTLPMRAATSAPTASATRVSALTWEMLRNAAYPTDLTPAKTFTLVNGSFRMKYTPDSATELKIGLAEMRCFGDLDGDGLDDAAAVLIADPGGSGTFYYLYAVLNDQGTPRPTAVLLLGDRIKLHSLVIEAGQVRLEMDTQGEGAPMYFPDTRSQRHYALQSGQFVLLSQSDMRIAGTPPVPRQPDPERLTFAPGVLAQTISGKVDPNQRPAWLVSVNEGQTLILSVSSARNDVLLSVYGHQDNRLLVSVLDRLTRWTGEITVTQDYLIRVVPVAGSVTDFALSVGVADKATPTPAAAPPPTTSPTITPPRPTPISPPPGDKVAYLTFDDGPIKPWTRVVQETLAEHNAKATFFVLGQLLAVNADLIASGVAAGHTMGNHTFDHVTLSDIGREEFIQQIVRTQKLLAEAGTNCMRPPYGATDAFTLAYAEELGFRVVMWDVDTRDWSLPGAQAIVDETLAGVRPGAIILMHDGGGDRQQTVAALDLVLPRLKEMGYRFETYCTK